MFEVIDSCVLRTFLSCAGFALGSAEFRWVATLGASAQFEPRCSHSSISLSRASLLLSKTTLAAQSCLFSDQSGHF